MIRLGLALAGSMLLGVLAPAGAQGPSASPSVLPLPATAHAVIERMVDRNPSLSSYTARVHVNLHMLNFPFLAPKLDGTSYFKRPNHNEVVFDRVPSYAKGFEKLFNDVGDPTAWEDDWNVDDKGLVKIDTYPNQMIELYMTKKIYSDQTADAIAYVDPGSFELLQMQWDYRNGGKIVMRQSYRDQGTYSLVGAQHVEISIPHVHAVGDSQFETYQTNVALDDSVFKK
ncbi:MAG: hypothetical protein JO322_05675 [Candidatus Eremiobacteraeota bacterium]|nr:hypothetical protein [Candidatus Eremiobacteraeota bacterium]